MDSAGGHPRKPATSHPGQDRGPWRVLQTREVYKNQWMRLREDAVLRPDGKPGIYGVVELEPAVGIVPIDDDGRVCLVGQYRYPTESYSWEVVSGFAEAGESIEDAAGRELREEAGLTAREWVFLGRGEISNSVTDQVSYLFLARGLTSVGPTPEETEALVVRTLSLDEAVRMAQNGGIVQAFSAAAIFRAWHHLKGDLHG